MAREWEAIRAGTIECRPTGSRWTHLSDAACSAEMVFSTGTGLAHSPLFGAARHLPSTPLRRRPGHF
ncbi:hypothetical protein [Streptomyces sp. NPDC058371]|jgi:hypothetical protein|uniref:hypothetical protein n=1 Tax=Streptomyces sp. NPDC058371 TaxID=3346463 RepID=UPI0036562893